MPKELYFSDTANLKKGRVRARTAMSQFEGLVETAQEFHKEGLLMQVNPCTIYAEKWDMLQ